MSSRKTQMRAALVSGVAGFIGAHVARRLQRQGYAVVGVDDLSGGSLANVPAGIEFIQADLTSPAALRSIPKGCGLILHLAGQSSGEISFDDPAADLSKNALSTLNLIRYGIDNRAERLVYASSMSVYGKVGDEPIAETHRCAPLSCYGVGKLAAEGYLQVYQSQLPAVRLRMFNVYGPGQDMGNLRQGMVSIFVAQALASGRIEVKGSLERFRDFIFIDDVVEAWWRAATYPQLSGRVLNVGTGVRTSVGALLGKICARIAGAEFHVHGSTPGDQSGIYADTRALTAALDLERYVDLDEGLERFIAWARAPQAGSGGVLS